MSNDDRAGVEARHRFFHAMVVMGGALAFGCGGMSGSQVPEQPGAGGSSSDAGTGGSGGASANNGGSPGTVGLGGTGPSSAGTGGASTSGTGGGVAGGGISTGGITYTSGGAPAGVGGAAATGCPTEQWSCNPSTRITCRGRDYALSPDDTSSNQCVCDPTRPRSAADCAADQSFVCHAATLDQAGVPLAAPVPFECECIAQQTNCDSACNVAFPDGSRCIVVPGTGADDPALCDCALILLR